MNEKREQRSGCGLYTGNLKFSLLRVHVQIFVLMLCWCLFEFGEVVLKGENAEAMIKLWENFDEEDKSLHHTSFIICTFMLGTVCCSRTFCPWFWFLSLSIDQFLYAWGCISFFSFCKNSFADFNKYDNFFITKYNNNYYNTPSIPKYKTT